KATIRVDREPFRARAATAPTLGLVEQDMLEAEEQGSVGVISMDDQNTSGEQPSLTYCTWCGSCQETRENARAGTAAVDLSIALRQRIKMVTAEVVLRIVVETEEGFVKLLGVNEDAPAGQAARPLSSTATRKEELLELATSIPVTSMTPVKLSKD
ncbi:hypothetical protein BGZ65_011031, partial [Modicella reniformis]